MMPVWIIFVLATLMSAPAVVAQESDIDPAGQLPGATVLGEGWSQYDVVQPDDLVGVVSFAGATEWIAQGAVGLYSGPDASRIVVANLLVDHENFGVRGAWDDANNLLLMLSVSVDPDYESMLSGGTVAPPSACEEAERIGGTDRPYNMPFGATMCAYGDASIWIFIVSGTWNGVTGTEASDALAEATLNTAG